MEFLTLLFGSLCRQRKIKFNQCITSDAKEFRLKLRLLREQADMTINDQEVLNLINRSLNCLNTILSYAHEYDFENVPCNGFRSILLIAYHSLKYGIDNWIDSDDTFAGEFITFLTSHLDNYDCVEKARQYTAKNQDALLRDEEFLAPLVTRYFSADCRSLEPLYSKFAGLIHGPDSAMRICTKLFHMFLIAKNPSSLLPFKFLTQTEFYVPTLDRTVRTIKITDLPKLDSGMMSTLTRNTYTLFAPAAYINDFTVSTSDVSSEYVIQADYKQSTVKIGYEANRKPIKVRCMLVRKSNKLTGNEPFAGNILIYLHGGAWTLGSPDFQLAFLPRWTHMMPGLTILCPQQSKLPEARFPSHLQSYLDLYMWLIKSPKKELTRHLGLSRVSSIILAGDSSGAFNAINLLHVLNDIKNGFNLQQNTSPWCNLSMPFSLHLFYPALSINRVLSPSFFISPHHWALNPSLLRSVLFTYVQHKDDTVNREEKQPEDYSHEDTKNAVQVLNNFIIDHPYCDPVAYENVSSLKSTSLHVLTIPSDIWIDHTIALLNKWPGECSLNTVEDLPHAFLILPFLGKQYDQVVDALGEKLKLDFLKALTLKKPDIFLDFNYN